jgi:hypothetical protein
MMEGATARATPTFAIPAIVALDHIAFAFREVGYAVEVAPITEGRVGRINEFAWYEVVIPGIAVDACGRGRRGDGESGKQRTGKSDGCKESFEHLFSFVGLFSSSMNRTSVY